ncbi:MAG: hypothetical protein HY010_07595 [Acidobacteria bacterium]|nr:hypothetical protein [Acidobacteriota bacterium]
MKTKSKLSVGDWVEVRSKEEILSTLDHRGCLDGTPFMPEMFQFCGQRFQVYKRAHKTCDYSTPYPFHTRRLEETVHLETRCDGSGHGGCQAGCLLFWKHAWLKPVDGQRSASTAFLKASILQDSLPENARVGCTESRLLANTVVPGSEASGLTYVCQATQVPQATKPLSWWDVRQYLEDYWSGNVSVRRLVSALIYSSYFHLSQAGIGLGPPMRWFYDKVNPLWGGSLFPRKPGLIPEGNATPTIKLDLQPGELVRVKSHEEILKTVDSGNRNRGMFWDAELVPYCGKTFRVLKRVTKLIDERNGKMMEMKNPCIILDSVICQARYSSCRMLCPKGMYPYWREIWLERV